MSKDSTADFIKDVADMSYSEEIFDSVKRVLPEHDFPIKIDNNKNQIEIAIAYLKLEYYAYKLNSCANKLSSLEKVKKLSVSSGRTIDKINLAIDELNDSVINISIFAERLAKSYDMIKKQFQDADSIASGIYPKLSYVSILNDTSSSRSADSLNSGNSNNNVQSNINRGQCLNDIWRDWGSVSPNGFTNYNGKGNCTWYADNRWSQNNPDYPLSFSGEGRNAKYWADRIDKSKFDVNYTSDINNIKRNAIAVSTSGEYGHVAYVEDVRDGMVFYTEDGESYTRPHTWQFDDNGNAEGPTVQCCSVEEFSRKFAKIITKK